MTGSGTCRDVCEELRIPCCSFDIRSRHDASDPVCYAEMKGRYDFVWIYPPYWRMKKYTDDPRDLSNAPDMIEFYRWLRRVIRNCKTVLTEHGRIAVLMGEAQSRPRSRERWSRASN